MTGRYDAPKRPAAGSATLLVVDDEASNVRLMQRILIAEGFTVLSAPSGPAALEILGRGGVDLMLLDIRMPGMDGFEVCRQVRGRPELARLPVVFVTAESTGPDSELDALEVGADEYLHKPIRRRELLVRVRSLLRLADAERDRRLMAQLAQSEKLATIGQIAAGVAHEINNPLAFVLSNLSSLRDYLGDMRQVLDAYRSSTDEGKAMEQRLGFEQSLQDIESLIRETADGGQRVRSIVQELKTFSRSDDAAQEPVDLADVAASTLLLTERELSARAKVVKALTPAKIVRAPRGKLHQVVLNLLVNALQALEGTEQAKCEIRISTSTEGEEAVLKVTDTGCGISAEHQARIFDPFFTTKPVGVGTGIGLSVCAMVVGKLGGRISVESVPGQGSTFTIRVPVEPPEPAQELAAGAAA